MNAAEYSRGGSSVKDGTFWGWGGNNSDWGKDLRGQEFLNWDFFIWDEGFEWWVLKGREGGPIFFVKLLTMEGFLVSPLLACDSSTYSRSRGPL